MKPWQILADCDHEVYHLCERELVRQHDGLELIASENFASPAVIVAMASAFTNKYAEGLPGKRYYGGCEVSDELENLAIERAKQLFTANHANVQPHSGAQANAAAYMALVQPGETILGFNLAQGGHLTHGSKVNFSGHFYRSHFYGVDETSGLIDYQTLERQARELRPKLIVAGASSYSRQIDFARFRQISDEVGAYLLVDMAHIAGLVASGLHDSPLPWADVVSTTTHKTLRGPRGGLLLWNNDELSRAINRAVFPGIQGGPLQHIIAAKAVCFREANTESFRDYQRQVIANSKALGCALRDEGFQLVSGGSDNHLLLIDLRDKEISGKDFENALGEVAITANKNMIPGDQRSPFVTSGLRVGTPAVTSRGMKEQEMATIANFLARAETGDRQGLRAEVIDFARRFPLYQSWIES